MMWCLLFVWLASCHPLERYAREIRATPWIEQTAVVPEGDDAKLAAERLTVRIREQLVAIVVYSGMEDYGGVLGLTLRNERHILVHKDLGWNARLVVLAHEAGHLLQPRMLTDAESEVFVEGVSWLVGRRLHGDFADEAHRRYLAQYKALLWVWRAYRADILYAVELLAPPERIDWRADGAFGPDAFVPAIDLEDREGQNPNHQPWHDTP